jgi:ankyrin repeat protein
MHAWARAGAAATVKELLDEEPGLADSRNAVLETPLHAAAKYGRQDVVLILLAAGADVNAKCSGGGTPLHFAATFDYGSVVQLLVAKGARVNDADDMGVTPLHYAVSNRAADASCVLLSMGADANCRDKAGKTPLDVARRVGDIGIVQMLSARLNEPASSDRRTDL